MNFGEIKAALHRAMQRDDLLAEHGNFVNRGIRSICQDYNWRCLQAETEITIRVGNRSISMPDGYKCLQPGRSPITLKSSEARQRWLPCDVTSRKQLERLDSFLVHPLSYSALQHFRGYPVFISTDSNGRPQLELFEDVASQDLIFKIAHYRVLPPLQRDTDSNYLTDTYEEMVLAKVKSVGFEDINDPSAGAWEELYTLKKTKAQADDAYREFAGRRMQMGG